ncbi:hypothetical protein C8P65_101301 [Capnocytophaga leadbetteri]|uniref:Uncharacterized protein n=1 Tax=Capnocytophaga leadbetteri TaxID=327575 RepID=A0A2T5XYM3_9FLAO|nr:hypothetical protein C8P65_101301 [Capnocytophaga leadbetteri]
MKLLTLQLIINKEIIFWFHDKIDEYFKKFNKL